ncbi:MAG: phosphatase PAP2 family protein [Gammaproteobacteria bacterium]|nr:phosphatase PAP2 family protein [Gammaproteobacteria bacterium]MDE2263694.1 phosphatase PAP2 family protein [Gammaproteobacteria bacterium]
MKTTSGSLYALILGATLALPYVLEAPAVHAQEASPAADSDSAPAQSAQSAEPGSPIEYAPPRKSLAARTLEDAEAYYTAPLHWNGRNWEFFGGALAAIAISHHYDSQARTHFDSGAKSPLGPANSGSLTDALPGAALFLGTWGYATLIGSHAGESEAWNMLESGGLSFVNAYALKYIVRRPRPDATTDANHLFGGGDSFPSEHVTAAFAVGTVLAESGNPEFRWLRRTIGYGVGFGTAYLRMKHNAHWLSDTVAGAALGMATAHFVMNRSAQREDQEGSEMSLVPVQGGVMLAFSTDLPN